MKRSLAFGLLFTAAYILIFSSPLKKEPILTPVWVQNLSRPTKIANSTNGNTVGFRIGDVFGYATPDGAIKYLDTTQFNVAMADKRFINYSSVSKSLVEKNTAGRITQTIDSRGYPIFMDGRSFVINTDRTALTELDSEGSEVWSRDFGSLITSMDVSSALTVVGLLNGSVVVVTKDGRIEYRYTPGGSKVSVVYGCAISSDGEYVALVSGLDPQKFILLARDKNGYRPRMVVDLAVPVHHQVHLHFFPNNPYVYVESPGAINYFGTDGHISGFIPVSGAVSTISAANDSLVFAVSKTAGGDTSNAGTAELTVFAPPARVIARSVFNGRRFFVTTEGDSLFLGADKNLMRIDYVRE